MRVIPLLAFSMLILLIALVFQPPLEREGGSESSPLQILKTGDVKSAETAERTARPVRLPQVDEPSPSPSPTSVRAVDSGPSPLLAPTQAPSPTPVPTLPSVVSYQPARNALLNDLHTPLVINFDADQRPSTAQQALTIVPPVPGQITWPDEHTLIFSPSPGWAPGTRYEVNLEGGWYTWFRTDPLVKLMSPPGRDAVGTRTSISVLFGTSVDRASVESAFNISPTVAGRTRWADDRRFVFEPDQPLAYVTTYRVSFEGELRDASGTPLPDVADWAFTTRSALVSASPRGSASVENAIQLKFDAPMDRESVEAALTITPSVAGSFAWQGNVLSFTPEDYWDASTTYHVSLSPSVRDAAGRLALLDDYQWRFSTQSTPRTIGFGYGPNIQVLDADGRRAVQLERYGVRHATFRLYALDIVQFLDRYTSSFRGVGPEEDKPIETRDLSLIHTWEQALETPAEVIIPSSTPPGLYVLEAQGGPGRDQLIVVLTRHTLVVKQAEGQLVTWASTMTGHAPAVGMHLRFYDRDGTLVAEGATEARGLHRTVVSVDTEPLIVVGELDGDITVSGLGNEWQADNGWWWWGWWKTSPSAPDATIYPYTDRPIYRPGQTIHARAVIRRDDDAVYSLPDGIEVVLRLRDARDNVVATRRQTADEYGAVYADFEIADGGTVGTYNLEVSALGESVRQPFLVEAYRKPDYEVALIPAQEDVVAGEPLTLTVLANYFFGPPVAGAKVELLPYVSGYDDEYDSGSAIDYGFAHENLRRFGSTDADGRFTVVLPAQVTNDRDGQTWNIEATVTDASDLSVSGHARVIVHRAAFGLSLDTDRYHYRPGQPIPVTVLALDHYSQAQRDIELTVGLYAWERATSSYSRAQVETQATTQDDGRARVTLNTVQPGWYQMRATCVDDVGREIQAQSWVWIYDAASVWDAGSSDGLRLSTDRTRYAPGDSASLLIESPVSGPALLSFERGTTRRETVIHLDEGLNTLEFELLPDDAPNVYVSVAVWRPTADGDHWRYQSRPEEELLTARTEILVPADGQRLTVTITPDRSQYAPRDEAVFLVETRDSAGRPVQSGFSLALVDEAIFALAADQTPDIFDAFYQPRPDIVRTYHSLRPTRWLEAWGMGGGGGADFGGSPRSDFPDTAFWAPALTTDTEGQASVRVPLPDSLTRWRVVVRAVTVDTKVGQATGDITVALPLSIQPVLPRFLVQGDHAILTAVVHNHTGLTQTAAVRLSLTGLELYGTLSATQQITLPANGTLALGWPVVASQLGQASVRMDVATQTQGDAPWRDAVVLPLTVLPRAVPQVDTVAFEVEDVWVGTITLPDAALPDVSRWELSLAPSIATGMLDGLEFLIDYPFG